MKSAALLTTFLLACTLALTANALARPEQRLLSLTQNVTMTRDTAIYNFELKLDTPLPANATCFAMMNPAYMGTGAILLYTAFNQMDVSANQTISLYFNRGIVNNELLSTYCPPGPYDTVSDPTLVCLTKDTVLCWCILDQ